MLIKHLGPGLCPFSPETVSKTVSKAVSRSAQTLPNGAGASRPPRGPGTTLCCNRGLAPLLGRGPSRSRGQTNLRTALPVPSKTRRHLQTPAISPGFQRPNSARRKRLELTARLTPPDNGLKTLTPPRNSRVCTACVQRVHSLCTQDVQPILPLNGPRRGG